MKFPSTVHERAAESIVRSFADTEGVDAILVTGSCARGAALEDSDLDMAVLASRDQSFLRERWDELRRRDRSVADLERAGPFATVHLDVIDGTYEPTVWDDGGGPDDFELEIGNHVAYSQVLWQRGHAFDELRQRWLPYYDEHVRTQRLAMVRDACLHDLDAVTRAVDRRLYFHAFDKLYKAFKEFVQVLFIDRRAYPLAYDKWIEYQIVDLLGLPDLYKELPRILEVETLESDAILANREHLRGLVDTWVREP